MRPPQTATACRRLIVCKLEGDQRVARESNHCSSIDETLHDLKNLLLGMEILLKSMIRQMPLEQPGRESLDDVSSKCREARELCSSGVFRTERRTPQRPALESLDLGELIDNSRTVLQCLVSENTIFRCEPATRELRIEGNRRELNRVLLNLVKNAAEALDGNGGSVTIRSGVSQIGAAAIRRNGRTGQFAYLEVTDSGRGMDEPTISRLFDGRYSTKGSGRGLGLLSVHNIVAEHHGLIELRSTPDRGTTFRILLPLAIPSPRSPGTHQQDGEHVW